VGGQEKFGGKTRFYYEHAVAGIVVADATKPKTIKVSFFLDPCSSSHEA